MTEGEIALAFLGVESKYRKTDEELRERIRAGGCVQTREQHDHFGAGMPEVFSLSEIVI